MKWQNKRKVGKCVQALGWCIAQPGIVLAWPGLCLNYWGQNIQADAMAQKFEEQPPPAPRDPNFVKATRVE